MKTQRSIAAVLAIAWFVTALPAPAAAASAVANLRQVKSIRELNLDEAVALLHASYAARPNSTTLAGPSPFRSTAGLRVPLKLWLGLMTSVVVYGWLAGARWKY